MGWAIRKVTNWGWVGVGTTANGVAKVVLPQETKRAVVQQLRSFNDRTEDAGRGAGNRTAQELAEKCADALMRYLQGEPVDLSAFPVDWEQVPPAARPILQRLRESVKRGQRVSYGALARLCGKPNGARLVGWAMAVNPVPLLVPCHRVVRTDGSLGGFSGGLALKQRLLALEGVVVKQRNLRR